MCQFLDRLWVPTDDGSFYEWRVPHRTVRGLIVLCIVIVVTAAVPIWLLVKTMTFAAGASFFFLFPVATNFPEYRLLVSPIRRFLWNIPTHGKLSHYTWGTDTKPMQLSGPSSTSRPKQSVLRKLKLSFRLVHCLRQPLIRLMTTMLTRHTTKRPLVA
jgi:hypothetical protein